MAVKPEFCFGSGLSFFFFFFFQMIVLYSYSGIDKLYYTLFESHTQPFFC